MAKRGRLPLKKNLAKYGKASLMQFLQRLGVKPDTLALRRSLSYYLSQFVGVQNPEPDMLRDVKEQVDRRVRRWLEDQVRDSMSTYRWNRLKSFGPNEKMRWVSVLDAGTCQSCSKRHNRIELLKTWQLIGRPGSRQLRCNSRCRCRLIRARSERHDVQ